MQFRFKSLYNSVLEFYRKGFFSILTANFFIQLVAFLVLMYAATILAPEDIGRIKIMQAFVAVIVILGGLGAPTSILKLCGEVRLESEKIYILRKSLTLAVFGSIGVYLILSLLIYLKLVSNDPVLNQGMQVFGFIIIPLTVTKVLISYLQATKLFNKLARVQVISGIAMFILVIVPTYYFLFNGFIYGSLIASVFSFATFLLMVFEKARSSLQNIINNPYKLIWKYGKYPLWGNIVGQMILYFDLFLINYLIADKGQIGQYGIAVTFVGALHLLTATAQQISTPYFAEKSDNITEVKALYRKYIRAFLLISLVLFVIAQFAMPIILNLFFSNKYDDSIIFFRILSLAWLFKSSFALIGPVFIGIGKTKLSFYGALISFLISIGFYIYFVENYGLIGAALGTLTLTIITSVIVNVIYLTKVNRSI